MSNISKIALNNIEYTLEDTSARSDLINIATIIPSVDQTYNASSTNAVSGVAVANAISGKQDTITAGDGIDIENNVISIDSESATEVDTETITEITINELLESISGYNASSTQVLKNVNGTLTWVTEV